MATCMEFLLEALAPREAEALREVHGGDHPSLDREYEPGFRAVPFEDNGITFPNDITYLLMTSFIWDNAPHGREYWKEIYLKYGGTLPAEEETP